MDCRSGTALRKATSTPSALNSWSDDVDPAALQPEGPFFLALFAGKAGSSFARGAHPSSGRYSDLAHGHGTGGHRFF